jgi:general stress protein YciG
VPDIPKTVRSYMAEIGRKGGSVRSKAQKADARDNAKYGKRGGRPRLYPPCTKYRRKGKPGSHVFDTAGRCTCGYVRPNPPARG